VTHIGAAHSLGEVIDRDRPEQERAQMPTVGNSRTRWRVVALVGAGVLAGGALIGAGVAQAATPKAPTGTTAGSSATPAPPGRSGFGHGGAAPVRSDEKSLSADQTAALTAAALKVVPGATVYRVETDAGDGAYEVHLTKADGSLATVKFDKAMTPIRVESGMGQGDPAPSGSGPAGGYQQGPGPQGGGPGGAGAPVPSGA
jgi:hypothetical protein